MSWPIACETTVFKKLLLGWIFSIDLHAVEKDGRINELTGQASTDMMRMYFMHIQVKIGVVSIMGMRIMIHMATFGGAFFFGN